MKVNWAGIAKREQEQADERFYEASVADALNEAEVNVTEHYTGVRDEADRWLLRAYAGARLVDALENLRNAALDGALNVSNADELIEDATRALRQAKGLWPART